MSYSSCYFSLRINYGFKLNDTYITLLSSFGHKNMVNLPLGKVQYHAKVSRPALMFKTVPFYTNPN